MKVYAYLHTHWDREWYRDKEDFNLRFLEVFDIVLDELQHNRASFFYLDGQTIALLDYLKYRQEKKDLIIKLIKENKLAIGPFYVSADSYLVSFPFMLKNLDLGLKISKEFNQKGFIGYLSDIFGISNSIFEALKLKNIDKVAIWRGVNPKKINNNCDFIKNDIKTTWLVQGYFNDCLHQDIDIKTKAKNIEICLDKIKKYSSSNILLPIGADHLGILKNANKEIEKINRYLKNYEIILTSPFEYFKNTEFKNIVKEKEFLDCSDTYILPGVYSARIEQKIKNVILENKISKIIEPLNHYLKLNYQKNIDYAYETLIKNHAHDGIYGCSIDDVHKTIDYRLLKCKNTTDAILKRIIGDFKKKYNINGTTEDKIAVFNLSNDKINQVIIEAPEKIKNAQIISYKECFEDDLLYNSYKIPITEDIKKIYTQIVEVEDTRPYAFTTSKIIKPTKKVKIKENSIENEKIKFQIRNNKLEILNKQTKEKIDFKITDIKDNGDSYNFSPVGKYKELKLLKTKIVENGIIRCILRLYFKDIELDLSLDNNSNFITFISTINNKKKNHKIQIIFNTKNNIEKTIAQDAYGTIERKIDYNYKMQDYMPAIKAIELKTNSYPMQNFVSANNISILTKGLHEYEIYKNELRICLLRSFKTISNPKNKTRYCPAGPNLKTIDSQCIGITKQEFAILFGDEKQCFYELDKFFENYVTICGKYDKEINFILDKLPKNSYIYCLNNKKLIYHKFK